MRPSPHRPSRLLTLAALTLAVGTAGCDESQDSDGPASTRAPGAATEGERAAEARRAGRRHPPSTVVERFYRDLARSKPARACAAMTEQAQRQITYISPRGAPVTGRSCAQSLAELIPADRRRAVRRQMRKAHLTDLTANGNTATATATVSFGEHTGSLPLRRERGQWKLTAAIVIPPAPRR